jgi:Cys-tRNA(Pro) deacylase
MSKKKPNTPAIRAMRAAQISYTEYLYEYERYPGAHGAAEFIGIDPHLTAKTIVFATSDGEGVVVLMHGDLEVSTKKLARTLGVKSAEPATVEQGRRWTGYEFGGTSPLGLRTPLTILAERTLLDLPTVYVNAGSRGFVVGVDPVQLLKECAARMVEVST